jgi:hypothetical protein
MYVMRCSSFLLLVIEALHGTVANLDVRVSERVNFSASNCDEHNAELGKCNVVEFPTNWQV